MHPGPPQLSPDGKLYWDGTRWAPIALAAGHADPPGDAASRPRVAYGGVLVRFAAYVIDGFIVAVPTGLLFFVMAIAGALGTPESSTDLPSPPPGGTAEGAFLLNPGAVLFLYLFALIITAGYNVYFWGGSGSTLGMRLMKLRVVDATSGEAIGSGRAIVRFIGLIVAALPCWIGLIWAAFDPRAQGWHDKIASTVVVQT